MISDYGYGDNRWLWLLSWNAPKNTDQSALSEHPNHSTLLADFNGFEAVATFRAVWSALLLLLWRIWAFNLTGWWCAIVFAGRGQTEVDDTSAAVDGQLSCCQGLKPHGRQISDLFCLTRKVSLSLSCICCKIYSVVLLF